MSGKSWGIKPNIVKQWYLCVVEKILTYAVTVWGKSLTGKNQSSLLSAQRLFALLMTKGNSHTSTDALLVLAGIPPINVVVQIMAETSRALRHGSNFVLGDVCIENNKILKNCSAWSLPSYTFVKLQEFITSDNTFDTELKIYTDGSKFQEGVGAAFVVYEGEQDIHSWTTKLDVNNSVYQAELLAIHNAIEWYIKKGSYLTCTIYTDSFSSLKAIIGPFQNHPFIHRIRLLMVKCNADFLKLAWVPAHTGILGNEMADTLAKKAAQGISSNYTMLSLPPSHLKQIANSHLLKTWQEKWMESEKGRYTYMFFPQVDKERLIGDYLLNLFTNRGPFPCFKFKIQKSLTPNCVCGKIGDSIHYLTECTLTSQYHIAQPLDCHKKQWCINIAKNPLCHIKIKHLVNWLLNHELDILQM